MQSILLTGANGNLGQAVTSGLLSKGYAIEAATGRSGGEPFQDPNYRATSVDLMDESAAAEYVAQVTTKNENLAAGILLVGGYAPGDLLQTDWGAIDKMIALNFKTAWNVAKPLFEYFSKNGGGQIILVGTRSAIDPSAGRHLVAYSLSKSLIFSLAEIINAAGHKHNVRATVMVPSIIDTPQNRAAMPDADPSDWVSPEAIAETIAFALGDSGSQLRESVLKLYNKA